jgi:hypothetical protein
MAALGELINAGIITIERIHPKGSRMATEYRLTFIESGPEHHRVPASNEWRLFKSGTKGNIVRTKRTRETVNALTHRQLRGNVALTHRQLMRRKQAIFWGVPLLTHRPHL